MDEQASSISIASFYELSFPTSETLMDDVLIADLYIPNKRRQGHDHGMIP